MENLINFFVKNWAQFNQIWCWFVLFAATFGGLGLLIARFKNRCISTKTAVSSKAPKANQ